MRAIHNKLVVSFDEKHNKEFNVGAVTLIRPDLWFDLEKQDGTSQFKSNENKLLTQPQIVSVIVPNEATGYNKGEVLFVHYMAKEWEEKITIDGDEFSIIDADYVLFRIIDGKYYPVKDVFLGERIFTTEMKLDSGLFLNVVQENVVSKIKITHVPQERSKETKDIEVGDIVVTIDDNQYEINVYDKPYVKLTSEEIYAICQD